MAVSFDSSKHPRWPARTPGGRGGQFRETINLSPSGKFLPVVASSPIGAAMDDHNQDWLPGLSENEAEAIEAYTRGEHESVNQALRGSDGVLSSEDSDLAKSVELLDGALGDSKIPRDVKGYRMMSDPAIFESFERGDLVGGTFLDDGFTSTTLSRGYLGNIADYTNGRPIQATIGVPAGTRGAFLGEASYEPSEREMLLKRGSIFEVTSAEMGEMVNGDQGLLVNMEVVGQVVDEILVEEEQSALV